jgi:hypothetical protein
MRRLALAALFGLVVCAAGRAEDYTGKIKNLDIKKNQISVMVDDKEMTFPIAKDVSVFYETKPAKKKPGGLEPLPGGLSGLKTGNTVTITTEKKDNQEIATLIKLEDPTKKPDKKSNIQ